MKTPKQLHLCNGEVGGAGKSLFAKVLAEFALSKNYPFFALDCDRTKLDFLGPYKGKIDIDEGTISEDPALMSLADVLVEKAIEGKNGIVCLPAQAHIPLTKWFDATGALDPEFAELLETETGSGIEWVNWFVHKGTPDSTDALERCLLEWGDRCHHVIVRNEGASPKPEFSSLEGKEMAKLLSEVKANQIILPRLVMSHDEPEYLRLAQTRTLKELEEKGIDGWGILKRQRIATFLKKAFSAIEKAKILHLEEPTSNEKAEEAKSTEEAAMPEEEAVGQT